MSSSTNTNIGINGFGRIGKLTTRIAEGKDGVTVVAINDPFMTVNDIAYCLRFDSVHGRFAGAVLVKDGVLSIDGRRIAVSHEKKPADIPWGAAGVEIVVDCSGAFKTEESAGAHVHDSVRKVVISAPSDDVQMYVLGVNSEAFDASLAVVSNASCTTNCLAPLVKVVNDAFGIEAAIATTVHASTGTQAVVDLCNTKKPRLGRSAMANIIPSTTGAAAAVSKVLPALAGKITGMALRVPTPDVSIVDVSILLTRPASMEEVNAAIEAASHGAMAGIIEYTTDPVVSSDMIGNPHSCIYDADASLALNETFIKLCAWYDNEFGYSTRLVELTLLAAAN